MVRQNDFDDIIRFYKRTKPSLPVKTGIISPQSRRKVEFTHPKAHKLHSMWQNGKFPVQKWIKMFIPRVNKKFSVWLMALDRSRDIDLAIEDAEGTDFSFNDWRKKYMKFMKHKKSRVMDQMRKMDRNGTGYITNEDFIHHMVNSGFKTTEKEMRKVISQRVACPMNQTVINVN